MKDDCPCYGCTDRNAYCHMKGHCPHGFDEWREKHIAEVRKINSERAKHQPFFTAATEKKHFKTLKNLTWLSGGPKK